MRKNQKIGIIDAGSNTVRLAVFEVGASGFDELLDVKKVAGLSAYVVDGAFTQAGIDKATRSLLEHIQCAKNLGCSEVKIFATAVFRNAKNSSTIVPAIEKRIGQKIDLLSGFDEARLGLKGAFAGLDVKEGTLLDLGGGSCEITTFGPRKMSTCSLPLGCVSSYAKRVSEILPTKGEYAAIKKDAEEAFSEVDFSIKPALFGIGGSVRAIAKMTRDAKSLEKTPKHVRRSDISDIVSLLEQDRREFAHLAVKAVPDRVHSLMPGCAIIETIMDRVGAEQLDICKGGLREGYLLEMIK